MSKSWQAGTDAKTGVAGDKHAPSQPLPRDGKVFVTTNRWCIVAGRQARIH